MDAPPAPEKDRLKILQVKNLIQIIVKFKTEKKFCVHVCVMHQGLFWGAQKIMHKDYFAAIPTLKL